MLGMHAWKYQKKIVTRDKISHILLSCFQRSNLVSRRGEYKAQNTSSGHTNDGSDRGIAVFFSSSAAGFVFVNFAEAEEAALVSTISPLAKRTDWGIFGMGGTP
jgi:hypothetical protein